MHIHTPAAAPCRAVGIPRTRNPALRGGDQLAGHVVWEKNSPAFLQNLLQALVGPLFFVAVLTGEWPRPAQNAPTLPDAA